MSESQKAASPLAAYRVLDLTNESGVFCTKILAALGADVIKIEPPGGDRTRRIGPFYHDKPDPEKSLHWFTYNLNKRSVTLNTECATGQELFKRLVKTADFLVECFRPQYLDKLGLGYSLLTAINPRLIHTSITPYGSTGPDSQLKGANLTCSAASGYLLLCGDADRAPVQITTPVAYIQAGLEAAAATLVAEWYRQRTGEGQHVDVSIQESMMAQIIPITLLWKSRRLMPHRTTAGAVLPARPALFDIFECKDGYVLCTTTRAQNRRPLRDWLASEGLAGRLFDPEWNAFYDGATASQEQKNYIDGLFQAFAINHTREELMFQAQERGVQVAKEHSVPDVMEDPHLRERGYFVNVEHPELGETVTYAGAPFKSQEMSWNYWRRAPFIGEHNQEIYVGEMGLSQQELVSLKGAGVI